jgi:hypothetical protein
MFAMEASSARKKPSAGIFKRLFCKVSFNADFQNTKASFARPFVPTSIYRK